MRFEDSLLPMQARSSVDAVEIFADIIRWLEYTVLKTEFEGTLTVNGMVATIEVTKDLDEFRVPSI